MKRYFTLIELMVVIAIIGILLTILMPALSKARTKAKEAVCLSNEKQLAVALISYSDNSSGYFPLYKNDVAWDDAISDMMALGWSQADKELNGIIDEDLAVSIFACPADEVERANEDKYARSYAINEYKPNGGNDAFNTRALPGLVSTSKDHPNQSVNLSNVTSPHKVVLLGEQWRDWNMVGNSAAQLNGYGYSRLKYEAGSGWWESYQCHGKGRANILMTDGSAQIRQAQSMLDGSINDNANDYRESWLDHARD